MELKLSMDEKPLVKIRHRQGTNRCICEQVPPSSIRPDPSFSPQVYFKNVEQNMAKQTVDFCMSQATANNSTGTEFLRMHVDFMDGGDFYVAINEWLETLYLIIKGRKGRVDLKIFNLSFEEPDSLGFRKISSATEQRSLHMNAGTKGHFVTQAVSGIYTLRIFPGDGRLISHLSLIDNAGERNQHVLVLPAKINVPSKGGEALVQLVENRHGFQPPIGSYDSAALTFPSLGFGLPPILRLQNAPKASRFLFTSLNHLLVLFNLPPSSYLCSYDNNLNLMSNLKIRPAELFERLVPQNLQKSLLHQNHKFKGCFDVIGRCQKFVLFVFDWCVVGAKWPKEWYVMDKLPAVNQTIVCNLGETITQKQKQTLETIHFVQDRLYLTFATELKTPDVIFVTKEFHTINLDVTKFKDYRQCANCDALEKRKRRNKEGKRTAGFKVCRICRSLNLHHFHQQFACFYCSDECQKMHWNKHKRLHKLRRPLGTN